MNECLVCPDPLCNDCPECVARKQDAEFNAVSEQLRNAQQLEGFLAAAGKYEFLADADTRRALQQTQNGARVQVDRAHGNLARHKARWSK